MISEKAGELRAQPGREEEDYLELMAARHTGLVRTVAGRFFNVYGEDFEDLVQIGYIGLIKAVRKFDSERGLQFSTYAVPVIAGEIRMYLRDNAAVKMSRSLKADAMAVKKAENQYITTRGSSPRLSELSKMTGLSAERITEALTAYDALKNMEELEAADTWTDNEEKNIAGIDLRTSIGRLPEKERRLIVLRYYKDLTQQQTAKVMGLSQAQICRMEKNILKELAEKV